MDPMAEGQGTRPGGEMMERRLVQNKNNNNNNIMKHLKNNNTNFQEITFYPEEVGEYIANVEHNNSHVQGTKVERSKIKIEGSELLRLRDQISYKQ